MIQLSFSPAYTFFRIASLPQFPNNNGLCLQKSKQIPRIENPRKLAASFAMAVTIQTTIGRGCIARNGEDSLFRLLQRMLPQVK
jgi:hypothetical protein